MSPSSRKTRSKRRCERVPDWLTPSTSPSRRCSKSMRDNSNPSSVLATASSLKREGASGPALVTSKQSPAEDPRPIRPRSWWSWETPKRSASMTTMIVALGTSTPTSITVVDIRTSISPSEKACIVVFFSSVESCPCKIAIRRPLSGPACRVGANSSTLTTGVDVVPKRKSISLLVESVALIRGATTYAWWPLATSSRMRSQARSKNAGLSKAGMTWVVMGWRPNGNSRSVEISKSPKTVIATVRGIGVAVITNKWGGNSAFALSASLCSTPKRCCSSTTINPKSENATLWPKRACVPTIIPACPFEARVSDSFRATADCEPVISAICVACSDPPSIPPCASGPKSFSRVRICWPASTSVGAKMAACPPLSITASAARIATTVFPEPTSPCKRRCIGCDADISLSISAITSRWPAVNVKGKEESKASKSPPDLVGLAVALSFFSSALRTTSNNCSKKASSKVNRWRAKSAWSISWGWCRLTNASLSVGYPCFIRICSGRKSGNSSKASIAKSIHCAIFHEGNFDVAGYTGRYLPAKSSTALSTSEPSGMSS